MLGRFSGLFRTELRKRDGSSMPRRVLAGRIAAVAASAFILSLTSIALAAVRLRAWAVADRSGRPLAFAGNHSLAAAVDVERHAGRLAPRVVRRRGSITARLLDRTVGSMLRSAFPTVVLTRADNGPSTAVELTALLRQSCSYTIARIDSRARVNATAGPMREYRERGRARRRHERPVETGSDAAAVPPDRWGSSDRQARSHARPAAPRRPARRGTPGRPGNLGAPATGLPAATTHGLSGSPEPAARSDGNPSGAAYGGSCSTTVRPLRDHGWLRGPR